MKKIITFLGKYPKETHYSFKGRIFSGQVFAEALHQFQPYDRMLVFVTEQAKLYSWPILAQLEDSRIELVPIPLGKTTKEMWKIFDEIIDRVGEEDTVIFDITHGLRSTPFLMFLFAAFLKFARNVTIEAVYYGAYELGDAEKGIPAPVFDLSEFVNMLDWISATDRFITTGDGGALTQRLRAEMPPGIKMGNDLNAREIGKTLKDTADGIENMSRALRMVRPFEAMIAGLEISRVLQTSKDLISETARPFVAIVDKIDKTYGQFGLEKPLESSSALPNLVRQLGMAGWYLDHQQAVQATLLMREWLVSAFMAIQGVFPFNDRHKREFIEKQFNEAAYRGVNRDNESIYGLYNDLDVLPNPYCVISNWQKLSQMRNDIAHCGQRENAQSASALIMKANQIYEDLCQIANDILPLVL
jgi:CRISPR-associated DxTHG motif protein